MQRGIPSLHPLDDTNTAHTHRSVTTKNVSRLGQIPWGADSPLVRTTGGLNTGVQVTLALTSANMRLEASAEETGMPERRLAGRSWYPRPVHQSGPGPESPPSLTPALPAVAKSRRQPESQFSKLLPLHHTGLPLPVVGGPPRSISGPGLSAGKGETCEDSGGGGDRRGGQDRGHVLFSS